MTRSLFIGAALATALTLPAVAHELPNSAPAYPYASSQNNCPSGLQPIVMGGVICCGTATRHQSYASMMAHPVAKKKAVKKRKVRRVAKTYCPEGMKGCYSR